ncbi:hypothetical protein [Microbacterium sp. W4I20]|uniref:DUF7507 domain-containing protein n=1 Tax=Microbacterium sp. W4I20 TaxID=3042262 RepID=UPI0027846AC1|nr:hypothetical protein [Microbacterium sp. W4I20]MDQ0727169.1 hypothetical protein [Microbacterium sp. W4I20]
MNSPTTSSPRRRRRTPIRAGVSTITTVALGVLVALVPVPASADPLAAVAEILTDGTPAFDATAGPGFDTGAANGILRTGDDVQYDFHYNFDSAGTTDPVLRSELPRGMHWKILPTECSGSGTPASGIYNVAAGDRRVLVCQLPSSATTLSGRINPVATLDSTVRNGVPLPVSYSLTEAGGETITSNSVAVTASQELFPRYDLAKTVVATSTTPSVAGPNGNEPGQVVSYAMTIRTPWTNPKGGQVLAQPLTFVEDFVELPPFARMTECRGRSQASVVGCSTLGRQVTVRGNINASGAQFQISFAIPNSVIRAGADGVAGTTDDNHFPSVNTVRDFDPVSVSGVSNFGDDIEPLTNNRVSHDIRIPVPAIPGPTKLWQNSNGDPIGDGAVGPQSRLSGLVTDNGNQNITGTSEILCDVFDDTAVQLALIPNATVPARVEAGAADPFVIEYGRATTSPTTLAQHQASRCGDADATWSTDPTDPGLGDALTTDGYRTGIDRVRVRFTGPVTENLTHSLRVGFRVMSRSARTGTSVYNVGQKQFENRAWAQFTHRVFFSPGELSIAKSSVPQAAGTGNHYTAGSEIPFDLRPAIVRTGPITSTMTNVQVTDILPTTAPRLTVSPDTVTRPPGVQRVEFCEVCNGSDWSTTPQVTVHGVRWSFGDLPTTATLPLLSFKADTSLETPNGTQYLNVASVSSPTASGTPTASTQVIVDAPSTVLASKRAVEPLIPVAGTGEFLLSVRNNTPTALTRLDIIDVLPFRGDARAPASQFGGGYSDIDLPDLPAGMSGYVTAVAPAVLDSSDGTVDGYADALSPGTPGHVLPGTGIWACELDEVGTAGCPDMDEVTAVRIAGDGAGLFPAGTTVEIPLELTTEGNAAGDRYTNRFSARVDQAQLSLPVLSNDTSIDVVSPLVSIEKDVCTAAAIEDCDPADDSLWAAQATVAEGGTGVFRVRVTNTGRRAGDVVVESTLPDTLEFVDGSAEASRGDIGSFPTTWTVGNLASGESAALTFAVTIPNGTDSRIVNAATVSITDEFDQTGTDSDDAELGTVSPELEVTTAVSSTTDANGNGRLDVGDTIDYSYLVTNTGQIPFTLISVDATRGSVSGCDQAPLAAGASVTCTGSYVITEDDADSAAIVNRATVTGTPANGDAVTSTPSIATQDLEIPSSIGLETTARLVDLDDDGLADAGEEIEYSFLVENTGDVTLGSVVVDHDGIGVVECSEEPLVAGDSRTCTVRYTVSQADVDAGIVRHAATATGTPANGDPAVVSAPTSTDTATTPAEPVLGLETSADVTTYERVGQVITFAFRMTNAGNVTVTDARIAEVSFSGAGAPSAVDCPAAAAEIRPGAVVTCTATYALIQADLDAEELTFAASALASYGGSEVSSAADSVSIPPAEDGDGSPDPEPQPGEEEGAGPDAGAGAGPGAGASAGEIAQTGSDPTAALGLAVCLLLLGAALIASRRRVTE